MGLVDYATSELRRAGWFEEDSDYGGLVGPAVVKMVEQFAEEGHSGYSANLCLALFKRVAAFKPLTALKNPMETGEYQDVSGYSQTSPMKTLQSTRLSSVFSEDGGKTWYDIDLKVPRWKKWFGVRRHYIKFPYSPK